MGAPGRGGGWLRALQGGATGAAPAQPYLLTAARDSRERQDLGAHAAALGDALSRLSSGFTRAGSGVEAPEVLTFS